MARFEIATENEAGDDPDTGVLVDGAGYPTEWGLAQISAFRGTPEQLVELVRRLWRWDTWVGVENRRNSDDEPIVRVRLATGGWSGNEDVIAELDGTFFRLRFWESSHRGGLHIYEVPAGDWGIASWLGALTGPAE